MPKDLRLGRSIDLLPPERRETVAGGGVNDGGIPGLGEDSTYEVRYYWGCGEEAATGQPRKFTMTVRNGEQSMSGSAPKPRTVPQLGLQSAPRYALWPNQSSRKAVSGKASLVGAHSVASDGLAQAIDFQVDSAQDFMPGLELDSHGRALEAAMVHEALGDHIFEWFLRNKRAEWADYKAHVSQFELSRYLPNW